MKTIRKSVTSSSYSTPKRSLVNAAENAADYIEEFFELIDDDFNIEDTLSKEELDILSEAVDILRFAAQDIDSRT